MSVAVRAGTMVDAVRSRAEGSRVWDIGLVVSFSILLALFAQISVPLPFTPVPVSGQTLGVLLTGGLLGSRRGAAAVLTYLVEGTAGLPVFALGRSGWAVVSGPTGGYLVSFVLAALVVGWCAERGWDRSIIRAAVAMLLGEVMIYAVALPWLSRFVGANHAVALGLTPFIGGDLCKLVIAALVLPSGWTALCRLRPGSM